MPIKRDYKCEAHGFFEAWEAQCPHGCLDGIMIVHLQAPNYLSDRTKGVDGTLKGLAKDFDMTNMKSTREGEHQEGYLTRNNAPQPKDQPPQAPSGVIWGGGGGFSMQNVLAGGAVKSVRGESVGFNPKDAGNLAGPKPASYMADHEGLKIKS
jgi:hypothetical protein